MRLELHDISKSFPGVKALQQVNMAVAAGEVHALCGENGAGKSTLMNILSGNLEPDSGRIILDGKTIQLDNPQEAFNAGIAIVYQHLSLAENLSIAENIFANQQPVNRWGIIRYRELHQRAQILLDALDIPLHPQTLVSSLSIAEKQMVEIAKALSRNPKILLLDEPTASITEKETRILFSMVRKLKQQDVSIVYISHRLSEIFEIADSVTVLKDGKWQGTFEMKAITRADLIRSMVGRDLLALRARRRVQGEPLLHVENLSGQKFRNISFTLHQGEIVGLAGLVGAGRTELAKAIFGADPHEGKVYLHGKELVLRHAQDAIGAGIAYVPEERKRLGLFMDMGIRENVISAKLKHALVNGLYNKSRVSVLAEQYRSELHIATPGVAQRVAHLSGGNQQKVVLSKWLLTSPEVLIIDEPTNGIDVGAKNEIYEILLQLAEKGTGILMISSELPELIALCDRILVLKSGVLTGEVKREEASEEKIVALAT